MEGARRIGSALARCLLGMNLGRTMIEPESRVEFLRRLADTIEQALGSWKSVVLTDSEAFEVIANLREWANELDRPPAAKV
jgi:hypothetical protein